MKKTLAGLMVFLFGLIPLSLGAASLSLRNYSEVMVENLNVGAEYSMESLVNLPLIVLNGADHPIKIQVEALKPPQNRIKKGFEAIPDPGWVRFGVSEAEIPAQSSFKTDVLLTIPDDPKYLGKKFHVDIQARQVPIEGSGVILALAVKGRLLFTLNQQKMEMAQTSSPVNLDFALLPSTRVEIKDFPLGRKVEILAKDKQPIEIENNSKEGQTFLLQSLDPKDTIVTLEPGYEAAPDPNMLTFNREEVKIGANRKSKVKLYLTLPDKPEYAGRKYHFIASVKTGTATAGMRYLWVLVSTAGKQAGE